MWWIKRAEIDALREDVAEIQSQIHFLKEAAKVEAATQAFESHPFVTLGKECNIAPGVRIMAPDENHQVVLGDFVKLYRGVEIVGPLIMGERSFINRDGYIRSGVEIGRRVSIGAYVRLVTDNHDLGPASQRAGRFHTVPIKIGDGVWIGAGVTVIGGVEIGSGAVIGAGAVIVEDVPKNAVVVGVPGRIVRILE